ncbi:MAG: hypothetical protein ACFFC7_02520 [Candidatus Hermodarchaeota archaeon]
MTSLWSPKDNITTIQQSKSCPAALRIIPITRRAIEKTFILAQRISHLMKRHVEVYCFLLGDKEGVVRDILIPPQEVYHSFVEIPEEALEAVALSVNKIDSNYQVLGWAHSHANFSVFSSGTDDQNHRTILNQTLNLKVVNGIELKYAYGITVNEAREVYPVIITQYPCGTVIQRKGVLEIVEPDELLEKTTTKTIKELPAQQADKTPESTTELEKTPEIEENLDSEQFIQEIDQKIKEQVDFGSSKKIRRKKQSEPTVYPAEVPMRVEKKTRLSSKEKKFKRRFLELRNGINQLKQYLTSLLDEEKFVELIYSEEKTFLKDVPELSESDLRQMIGNIVSIVITETREILSDELNQLTLEEKKSK